MKKIYIIGGTMGVGKTAVSRELQKILPACVFLDGDWCWDSHPFTVNDETKSMVIRNIRFMLNEFLHCASYENVVFCWVMHEQEIIDSILAGLDTGDCGVNVISLVCEKETLLRRLDKDIRAGLRTNDIIGRSIMRLPLYDKLDTIKIRTDNVNAASVAETISKL